MIFKLQRLINFFSRSSKNSKMICSKPLNYIRNIIIYNRYSNSINCNFSSSVGCSAIRYYSKKKDDCCKNIPQTQDCTVEPWPKDPPVTCNWRKECPTEPQPPNYDPYRIKVPNVVVPPPSPSDVKWTAVLLAGPWSGQGPDRPQEGTIQQKEEPEKQPEQKEEPEPTGFFDYLKNLFGGGKRKDKGDGEEIPEDEWQNEKNTALGNVQHDLQNLFISPTVVQLDKNWRKGVHCQAVLGAAPQKHLPVKLGYHGRDKYKYAFHEPWRPLDRLKLLQEAEREESEPPCGF